MNSAIRLCLRFFYTASLLLFLTACGGSPDTRAKPLIDAEVALNSGTNAYYNDEYKRAAQQFLRALRLYQSLDHRSGVIAARINLAETAIVMGNYSGAEQQIEMVEDLLAGSGSVADEVRLRFLRIRLLFKRQRYAAAIEVLQPLLPSFDPRQKLVDPRPHSLNAVASMARLASVMNRDDTGLWIQRLRTTLTASDTPSPRYHALLLRLEAGLQTDSAVARSLLDEALALYKQLSYRRGIAATLQQYAELEEGDGNLQQAIKLFERTLRIQLWVLNRKGSREALQALIRLHQSLGHNKQANEYREQLELLEKETLS